MNIAGVELPTGFVGRSQRILQIRGQIEKIGSTRTSVLIQGESGTGKEVAARALFNVIPRGQFVPIDCGSLVGPLMESELFGHARNAFTGAGDAKRGLIDLANGGTAFFDEIGDLPLELQIKLLRVLQEREFRPVGSLQQSRIELRVIAATNRDLQQDVAAGRFREDLFHRLNVIRITLPPLRERKEDIPLLIERFMATYPARYIIAHETMDAMMSYDWPGNIRELKNCLERMITLSSDAILRFVDLPTGVVYHAHAKNPAEASAAAIAGIARTPTHGVIPLQEVERRAIRHALEHTRGDRTAAAFLLGIGRTTLYRKLKENRLPTGT
jgi:DNA-binding NtrC family response regulator